MRKRQLKIQKPAPGVSSNPWSEWLPIEQGKPLPGNIMLVVLRNGQRMQMMWKEWPDWPPIIGWTHYYPLPPF
jgi:hypothetical protein